MKNWILAYQTPYDSVKYVTNELSTPTFLGYYKFVDYILKEIKVEDKEGFVDTLDKFFTIFIDVDNHTWELHEEWVSDATQDELIELNNKKENEEVNKIKQYKEYSRGFREKKIWSKK